MIFHINSINLSVEIDGWKNTLGLTTAELAKLQNVVLNGNNHKKIDVPCSIDMAGVVYNGVLPVTLNCLRGCYVNVELPSVIEAHNEKRTVSVHISKSTFGFVNLQPTEYDARIISV